MIFGHFQNTIGPLIVQGLLPAEILAFQMFIRKENAFLQHEFNFDGQSLPHQQQR